MYVLLKYDTTDGHTARQCMYVCMYVPFSSSAIPPRGPASDGRDTVSKNKKKVK
jgi:hypothetical protein